MILRRVIAHFRKQEWTAIFLDFVIVVIGVFVGIQVSNWNGARLDRAKEQGLLVRLHEDFEESIAGQARDIRFLDQQLADQAVMLRSLDACGVAPEDADAFSRAVATLGFFNPPRLYRRTIDEMTGAGETAVIRNPAIREELASIIALTEWRMHGFDPTTRMTEHYRYIIEERTRYDFTRRIPDEFLGDLPGVSYDIADMCADPAVAAAVSAVSYHTRERRNAYLPLLDRYRAFLPMIEAELAARWKTNANEGAR